MAMRMLLWHRQKLGFSVIKEIIAERKDWMEKLQRAQYFKYQKFFAKIHYRNLQEIQKQKKREMKLRSLCLMGELPGRSIIDYFQGEGKQFSQDFTTKAFVYLAKASTQSQFDYNGSLDHKGYRMYNSPQFKNLSQQIKYGLKQSKFTISNMLQIGKACIELQYADYELFTLLLDQFHRYIGNNPQYKSLNEHNNRHYQIQKYGYYDIKDVINQDALLANASFKQMLEIVRDKHKYDEANFIGVSEKISADEKKIVQNLLKTLKDAEQGFIKLVNAIISLRDGYRRMVKMSGELAIGQESGFVLDLLELEQGLLMAKILNIDDIRNPTLLDHKIQEVARVQQILTRLLNIEHLEEYQMIMKKDEEQIIKKDPLKEQLAHLEIISQMIEIVSGLGLINKHLYCNNESRSLVSLKWEKTLIENEFIREDLNVPRYFRRTFRDSYEFIKKYQNSLQKLYAAAPVAHSFSYYESLLKMGFYTQTINSLSKRQLQDLKISELSFDKLQSFMSVLNNVGIYLESQPFQKELLQRLASLISIQEFQDFHLNLRFCLDVSNYLIQNIDLSSKENKQLYSKYTSKIQKLGQYYVNYEKRHPLIEGTFLFLATELPQKYANTTQYLQYLKRETANQQKSNPHLQIVRDIVCKTYLNIPAESFEMKQYIQAGALNGKAHGLSIVGSQDSSLDGLYLTGDYRSYLARLERNDHAIISAFPVNNLFTFSYAEDGIKFTFNPPLQIIKKLNNLMNPGMQVHIQFQQNINKVYKSIAEFFKSKQRNNERSIQKNDLGIQFNLQSPQNNQHYQPTPKVVTKIGVQIEFIPQILRINNEGQTEAEVISRQIDLFIHLRQIEKDLSYLKKYSEGFTDESTLKSYIQEAIKLITQMQQILKKKIQAFKVSQIQNAEGINLNGKRLTIQTYENEGTTGSIGTELIESIYYLDKAYVEYQDWAEDIANFYECSTLKYEEMSPQNKILVRKYCKHVNHLLSTVPLIKKSDKIKMIKLNLEKAIPVNQPSQTAENTQESQANLHNVSLIINLQNWKHELKLTKTKDQMLQYILGFKFIDQMKYEQLSEDPALLPRNGQAYFSFLEGKAQKQSLESPYITYILNKLQKTEDIKQLFRERTALRIYKQAMFREGKITRQQYYDSIGKMEDKIIVALQGLKSKMLDDMDDTLLDGGLKMVDIEVTDINALMAWFRRAPHYDRLLDDDFIYADGDYQQALNRKRMRAQTNLKKMAVIHRIIKSKVQSKEYLTPEDKQYLQKWRSNVFKGQNFEKCAYSKLKIKDLCEEDRNRLKLVSSDLAVNKDMLLIDLVFELNNFVDERVLKKVQKIFLGDTLQKSYKFNHELFLSSLNKQFSQLSYQKERLLLDNASRLQKEELDSLQNMVRVFKVEGYVDRNRYAVLFKDFRQNLSRMNTLPLRGEFISQYIRKLQYEFFAHYNPTLVDDLKKREVATLWKNIFGNVQKNDADFRKMVRLICSRVELMSNNVFPFFGHIVLRILEHPATGELLKETLIASLQKYKVDLKLDSKDIQRLLQGQKELDQEALNRKMLQISNKNLINVINSKIHEL